MNNFLHFLILVLLIDLESAVNNEKKRKTAIVLIADGSEALEAVVVVDLLRYANVDVTLAGIKGDKAKNCTNGVKIVPDVDLREVSRKNYDAFILLGGYSGPIVAIKNQDVNWMLTRHFARNKLIALSGGAVILLLKNRLFYTEKITSSPYFIEKFPPLAEIYSYVDNQGVISSREQKLITSRGPTTSFEFAYEIIQFLLGENSVQIVKEKINFF